MNLVHFIENAIGTFALYHKVLEALLNSHVRE
jgi:hypothetical protein